MEKIDWEKLPFGYLKTNFNVRCNYRNGEWGELEVHDSEFVNLHMAATSLHYGQEVFEGLKAYRGADDKIRLFRVEENARRFQRSANGILMPELPVEKFTEAVNKVVAINKEYVPPHGTGGTLYIRPLLIGYSAEIGVKPAKEYLFIVFVSPVGPYFKEGFKPVNLMICRNFDRTAPLGTGSYKVGGNYAASLKSLKEAHDAGYSTTLYLDAKEKKYIDEAGPANFFGIKGNTYITPESKSILPSITNMSLMDLAAHLGINVEKRPVLYDELSTFDEVGACGTAAVIAPVGKIYDPDFDKTFVYSADGHPGPICQKLYRKITDIQFGDEEDIFGWIDYVT
ncbi:MAG: branched-chain amino acid aminotransferase [Bacteroidetes bacterium]|jgi:branched-chain amino acid aminotransferase|nr:branched-chain amino acid aminotransferase [Bacteroidota bacterium]